MNDKFRVSDLAENTDKGLEKFNGNNKDIIAIENNKLLTLWIGKNANKILNINLNISVLFLGELYFFYRKMYLEGIIIFLIKLITFILVPYKYLIIIYNMILFFITNKIYKSHINKKIKKLKPIYSSNKLEVECEKRGGIDLNAFLIALLLEFFLIFLYIYKYVDYSKYIKSFNKDTPVTIKKEESKAKDEYNGKLSLEEIGINEFDFGYPSYWTMEGSKAYYNFDKNKNNAYCRVEIGKVKGFSNAEDLTMQVKKYHNINDMTITTINTVKWYKLYYTVDNNIIMNSFSQKDDKVIIYSFIIEKNAPVEKCEQIDREIFRNIKPFGYKEQKPRDEDESTSN